VPTDTVKYELDKASGIMRVDRPQRFSSLCPTLYGFVPQTYCGETVGKRCDERLGRTGIIGDGDPLDICVVSERPIDRSEIIVPTRVVGGIQLLDRGEADDKIIGVLENDLIWGDARDVSELPHILVERLRHYFSTYKLIPGGDPQIVIQEIYGHEHAMQVVEASIADYETLLAVGEG